MPEETIKTGSEILDVYFNKLCEDTQIDPEVRKIMKELWEQKRLTTTTYLNREIDSLIEKRSK
jgi:galactokinase/mevalonate kinase-like predicted kinase